MHPKPLLTIDLPGIRKIGRGKVRDMFDLGDRLLMVASDRISAFDCIMPNGIPNKGAVLTQISHFWFDLLEDTTPNHRLLGPRDPLPDQLAPYADLLEGRSMIVKKAEPLSVECVVRGYLAGSGWLEYQKTGSVCGVALPSDLRESDELPSPIFTPATKAVSGHDENITFEQAADRVGEAHLEKARDLSLQCYQRARLHAASKGVIIADTKFEFGVVDGQLILIDEVLTPDSSRFWPSDRYEPGKSQPSFDKQFVRDYLLTLDWDRTPPAPELPEEIVDQTSQRYLEAFQRLTGQEGWR